ncbi:hypothetical protein [Niallia sp.]|nr:hypothetical protein [Niallia sp.]
MHCDHELEKQWQVKKGALNSIIEIITKVITPINKKGHQTKRD